MTLLPGAELQRDATAVISKPACWHRMQRAPLGSSWAVLLLDRQVAQPFTTPMWASSVSLARFELTLAATHPVQPRGALAEDRRLWLPCQHNLTVRLHSRNATNQIHSTRSDQFLLQCPYLVAGVLIFSGQQHLNRACPTHSSSWALSAAQALHRESRQTRAPSATALSTSHIQSSSLITSLACWHRARASNICWS